MCVPHEVPGFNSALHKGATGVRTLGDLLRVLHNVNAEGWYNILNSEQYVQLSPVLRLAYVAELGATSALIHQYWCGV